MINSNEEFRNSIIAQADSGGYDPSGWVAVVKGDWAALVRFSHCSCYGTWTAITGGNYNRSGGEASWSWTGTPSELLQMAIQGADPGMSGRIADPQDYDYGHLMDVYSQVKKHFNFYEQ